MRSWAGARYLVLLVAAAALTTAAARAGSPGQIFSTDSSGMVKIQVRCNGRPQEGSGFLLGPRVVMTARHVLVDDQGHNCSANVVQQGTGKRAHITAFTAIGAKRDKAPTDLALALLDQPLTGYDFSIAAGSPQHGALLIGLGYALNQPLSLNQGHVTRLVTRNNVRLIEMSILEAGGASGGPVLDSGGQVVGLTQYGETGFQESVDLPHLLDGKPSQLCFGVAVGQVSTVCASGRPAVSLLIRDGPPQVCGGFIPVDLPFAGCPIPASLQAQVADLSASCPSSQTDDGVGFLLGPRVLMTARQLLVDPKTGVECNVTAIQLTARQTIHDPVQDATAVAISSSQSSTDLSLAVLRHPLSGHYLSLRRTPPPVGTALHTVDVLGIPQATDTRVSKRTTVNGVPLLIVKGDFSLVRFGSPLLDSSGRVVGLLQARSSSGDIGYSVDLATLVGGSPNRLCFGSTAGEQATICPLGASGTTLSSDGPPEVCSGEASAPPFVTCAFTGTTTSTTPMTSSVGSCWLATSGTAGSPPVTSVSDARPPLFFVWRYSGPTTGISAGISFTDPTGIIRTLVPITTATPSIAVDGATLTSPAVSWPGTGNATDGTWTFTVTLDNDAHCSASVNVTAQSG